MAFQTLSSFPVRPSLRQGESIVGYVFRCITANGYKVNSYQGGVFARMYSKKPVVVEKNYPHLHHAVADTLDIRLERWQMALKRNQECLRKWGGLAKVQLGFCPRCIKYSPYHLSLWELPLVKACPEHGYWLLYACSHCGREFTWPRLISGFECGCGKPIGEMVCMEAEAKWLNLARKLASAKDVAVPYGMGRHVSPLFALRGYKLQDIYAHTDKELEFRVKLREDVPILLLPISRRLARENGIDIDFDVELQDLL
jgi:hypothetical protein